MYNVYDVCFTGSVLFIMIMNTAVCVHSSVNLTVTLHMGYMQSYVQIVPPLHHVPKL